MFKCILNETTGKFSIKLVNVILSSATDGTYFSVAERKFVIPPSSSTSISLHHHHHRSNNLGPQYHGSAYQCPFCLKNYSTWNSLKKHKSLYHREEPWDARAYQRQREATDNFLQTDICYDPNMMVGNMP